MSRIDPLSTTHLPSVVATFENGWFSLAEQQRSPNCDARPADCVPELLVIHAISLPLGVFSTELNSPSYIEQLFLNRLNPAAHIDFGQLSGVRVSAHFLIRRDGSLVQFVRADERAWHAGISQFANRERCNDFSIGVELEGSDFVPFETAQYDSLTMLTNSLLLHYPISYIAGHQDIAPGRKTDPGPFFDWAYYQQSMEMHFPLVLANSAIRFHTAD